ncbi:hypothetical protein [Pyruvatibacter mobilis]|uniref:hypothetical protein n=1 Tax=Pyruvatibacter mobilis TaxID=1712261 RepID=UPI003BAD5675
MSSDEGDGLLGITGSDVGDFFGGILEKGLEVWKTIENNSALNERLGLELQLRQQADNAAAVQATTPPTVQPSVAASGGFDTGSLLMIGGVAVAGVLLFTLFRK